MEAETDLLAPTFLSEKVPLVGVPPPMLTLSLPRMPVSDAEPERVVSADAS